jgi:uncharacterized damage-inducible protein DinB
VDVTELDDQGRPEPPSAGDEVATLIGFLEYQRATFAWKIDGLDAEGLRATVGVSSMTLGGMLAHLALVEDSWFTERLHGRQIPAPWTDVDWTANPDMDWHLVDRQEPAELNSLWQTSVGRSRTAVAEALADRGIGGLAVHSDADGRSPSLRWILVHMIEEYARHNGHADLLRESVDGETGE